VSSVGGGSGVGARARREVSVAVSSSTDADARNRLRVGDGGWEDVAVVSWEGVRRIVVAMVSEEERDEGGLNE
jgi:hypothetical protein